MHLFRAAAVLIACLLVAALLAGCGQRLDKAEYEEEVQSITEDMNKRMEEAAPQGEGPVPEQEDLDQTADIFEDVAGDLDELHPPEEIEGAHDQLIRGLRGVAKIMREDVRDKLEDAEANPEEAQAAVMEMLESEPFRDIEEAQKKFTKEGYDIGLFGNAGGGAGAPPPGEPAPPGGGDPPSPEGAPPGGPVPEGAPGG